MHKPLAIGILLCLLSGRPAIADPAVSYSPVFTPWHSCEVSAVALDRAEAVAASLSFDGWLFVWNLKTGRHQMALRLEVKPGESRLALEPTGKWLAVSLPDGSVRIVDPLKGKAKAVLKGDAGTITDMALSPDGRLLATASGHGAVQIWDTNKWIPAHVLKHESGVTAVAFSPDSKLVATASGLEFGEVMVWNAANGELLRPMRLDTPTEKAHPSAYITPQSALAFSPDGKLLAGGGYHYAEVWEVSTGLMVSSFTQEQDMGPGIMVIAFSADAGSLYTVQSGVIRVWNRKQGKIERQTELPMSVNTAIQKVVLKPETDRLLYGTMDGQVRLTTVDGNKTIFSAGGPGTGVLALGFMPDSHLVLGGCNDGTIRMWDARNGQEKNRTSIGKVSIQALAVSPDGKTVYHATQTGDVQARSTAGLKQTAVFKGHQKGVRSIALAKDGRTMVSGSDDGTVILWDIIGHSQLRKLTGHTAQVTSVDISPDGDLIASAGEDATVRLWDAATGKELTVLESGGPKAPYTAVQFSPDGSKVAAAEAFAGQQAVRIFDVATRKQIYALEDADFGAMSLAFSADGTKLLTANLGSSAAIFESSSGRILQRLKGFNGYGFAIAMSDDGRYIALGTTGQEGTVRIWKNTRLR